MHTLRVGNPNAPLVVFGHGWNRAGHDFINIAEVLGQRCDCLMLDFPGFGETPRPQGVWTTQEYAKATAELLAGVAKPYVWVGHSFGGRVGLRLGAMAASGMQSMVLVGAAGLKRQRRGMDLLRFWQRKYGYRLLKQLANQQQREKLRQQFSSADYLLRPDMQDIFVATVSEDQSDSAARIKVPTSIMVGTQDTEAPPEIARRLHKLIAGSELIELEAVGHIDVLTRSRQVIAKVILEHTARLEGQEA